MNNHKTYQACVPLGYIELIFGGDSLWSNAPTQKLRVTLVANYHVLVDDEYVMDLTQLDAQFDEKDWNIDEKGLIYTDKIFQRMLNEALVDRGYPKAHYSEQGMQGRNYVNFDWESSPKLVEFMEENKIKYFIAK